MLGLLHHGAEPLPAEQGLHRRGEPGRPPGGGGSVAEELRHPVQLGAGGGVGLIQVGGVRVGDQDELLPEVAKGDDAAEQGGVFLRHHLVLADDAEGALPLPPDGVQLVAGLGAVEVQLPVVVHIA